MVNKEIGNYLQNVFKAEMDRLEEVSRVFKQSHPNFNEDLFIERGFWQLCQRELPEDWFKKLLENKK